MPAFERLASPPPPDGIVAHIEAGSAPGDVVADLHGRGGWVARAAIDRQRRALTLESSPLTRLLADVVLRPPDLRHLDAAFSTLSASPRGDSSLKLAIGALFATKCATCDRSVIADEFTWSSSGAPPMPASKAAAAPARRAAAVPARRAAAAPAIAASAAAAADSTPPDDAAPGPVLSRKAYRCSICRDQIGGLEQRQAPADAADQARAASGVGATAVRQALRDRFPVPGGSDDLPDALLRLHTDRQIVGLSAILERIEGDLREAPVESALRLAFLHTVLPASRLGAGPGRMPGIRIAGGTVRSPIPEIVRERNPWLAFEEGFRIVRAFVQRIESGAVGPLDARLGTDLRSLVDGGATAVVRVATPGALEALARDADTGREPGRADRLPRIRLVLGQPPQRFNQERLAAAYHGTCWALGREAASLLPVEALVGSAIRAPWSWQSATLRRSLASAAPLMARDGRVVLLLDNAGPEALVAAVLGGVGAGYRVSDARLAEPDEEGGGVVELTPPGAAVPPGPRTRSGRVLDQVPGGPGDPMMVPGRGVFSPPERVDARPFSQAEAQRTITEVAVEVLRQRGEPARYERLLGEILIGLDRAGHLHRLVAASDEPPGSGEMTPSPTIGPDGPPTIAPDPIDRLLGLVRDELTRPTQQRLREIAPGRWWLEARPDRDGAAVPLSDRVEWAVYSLLSTAGPLPEASFFERISSLFKGHDMPDESLVRACLASYRSPASTPERLVTGDDVRRRTADHTELLARLADAGHRLGMSVWLGRREQARRFGGGTLGDLLQPQEQTAWLPAIARASAEDLEEVDCIWYLRGRTALLFEVEWTAMLGDVLLRRHARIPSDDRLVRFLVVAPERAGLVRHKLEASPVLQRAIETDNWHLVLWQHLRSWMAQDPLNLAALEPFLGLEPAVEGRAEQLGLFTRPDAVP